MRLDVETVQDVALLRQVIRLQEAEIGRLHKRLGELTQRLAQAEGKSESAALQLELMKLSEQLAALQQRVYGAANEKRPRPDGKPESPDKPPQTGHGPTPQPQLPHTEQRHELSESERTCPRCQHTLLEWPEQTEDSEEISVVQRRFVVTRHKRQKYRCSCNAAILTAPGPLKLIEGGRYSLDFAVEVAVLKYSEHLPLERQVKQMRRQGLCVTSQTLWGQLYALAQVLAPTYQALRTHVLSADVVHADETTWKLLDKVPSKTWYVWGLGSEHGTYYQLAPSREARVLGDLLAGYEGALLCDGYTAYQAVARASPQVVLCFCWAHVRRKFLEALPAYPQCEQALELIGQLYGIERELPGYTGLALAERADLIRLRTERRQKESAPILEQLQQWALTQEALPQSGLRKAITYMQTLWPGLIRFVQDGRLPPGRVGHWRGFFRNGESLLPAAFAYCAGASIRSLVPFPVPARRTGRADFPHPALLRCLMPSLWAGRFRRRRSIEAERPIQVLVRILAVSGASPLVLLHQPPPQPPLGVPAHGLLRILDGSLIKVPAPAAQDPVQLLHPPLRRVQEPPPRGFVCDLPNDPGYRLLRRGRSDVGLPVLPVVLPEGVPKEVKALGGQARNPALLLVQFQTESAHELARLAHHRRSASGSAADDQIVGIVHEPGLGLVRDFAAQKRQREPAEVHVRQERRDRRALRAPSMSVSRLRRPRLPSVVPLDHCVVEPGRDRPQDRPIGDASAQALEQRSVRDLVEVVPHVPIEHLGLAIHQVKVHTAHRQLGIQTRPKSVLLRNKVRLEDRPQHQQRRRLRHPISARRNSQRPLAALVLGDPHTQKGLGTIRLFHKLLLEVPEPRPHALSFDVPEGLPVDAGCAAISAALRVGDLEDFPPTHLVPEAVESVARFCLGFRMQGRLQLLNRSVGSL